MSQYVYNQSDGANRFVRSDLKGKHADYNLCQRCANFEVNNEPCRIAKQLHLVQKNCEIKCPVFECGQFRPIGISPFPLQYQVLGSENVGSNCEDTSKAMTNKPPERDLGIPNPVHLAKDLFEKFKDDAQKDTNPKAIIGDTKVPLHLWPEAASIMGCIGMLNGALKYGRSNYLADGARVTTYLSALKRHMAAYLYGEDIDPDDGVHHFCGMLSSIAILVDAWAAGSLVDDRNYPSGVAKLLQEQREAVKRLRELHADKDPKHFDINDAPRKDTNEANS